MSDPLVEKIHRALYGASQDPHHSDNNDNPDFLAGHLFGSHYDGETLAAIDEEWERRGSPFPLPESFRQWKRGFWSGRLERSVAINKSRK